MRKSNLIRVTLENKDLGVFSESAYTYWLLNAPLKAKMNHLAQPSLNDNSKRVRFYFDLVNTYQGCQIENRLIEVENTVH